MTPAEKQDHYDLLHRIEKNDRRFRLAQSVFMTIIGLILVGLVAAQFVVINNFQSQSSERAKSLKVLQESNQRLGEENKGLNQQTNRYIQCIARFFATTDRQTRVLTDLDKCTYEQNGQAVPGVDIHPTTEGPNTQGPQNTAPFTENEGTPGEAPVQPSQPTTPQQPAERPPARVLGIPVCIPFTNVCVRQ
jgi:hypothetical protein